MNTRFFTLFAVGVLIIVVAVVIILALVFHHGTSNAPIATSTPAAVGAAVTVHNDTSNTVQVQDCTAALVACASSNAGTFRLAAGASGTERNATGLRILSTSGHVIGCISLSGVSSGTTVNVSTATACPS